MLCHSAFSHVAVVTFQNRRMKQKKKISDNFDEKPKPSSAEPTLATHTKIILEPIQTFHFQGQIL
jgi:hypothetical protein